jgi:hypothetical protein
MLRAAARRAVCAADASHDITGEVLAADVGQWLNRGRFVLPEPGKRNAKV